MCHSLQPWGYEGLAFLVINIQTDSHLEPRPAVSGFGFIFIYLFISFMYSFDFLLPLSICVLLSGYHAPIFGNRGSHRSYMLICMMSKGFGCRGILRFEVEVIHSVRRTDTNSTRLDMYARQDCSGNRAFWENGCGAGRVH